MTGRNLGNTSRAIQVPAAVKFLKYFYLAGNDSKIGGGV